MVSKNWGYNYDYCINCKTTEKKHQARGMCETCYRRNFLRDICSICKKFNVISKRLNGEVICGSCNKRVFNPVKKKKCDLCGNIRRIDKIENSKLICNICYKHFYYKQPKHICFNCKELKIARAVVNGIYYCHPCYYYKFYQSPKSICDICKKLAKTSAIIENKRFCHSCYKILRKEHYDSLRLGLRDKSKNYLSDEQIKYLINRDKNCVYCNNNNNKLTFDHIVPISKGGKSELNNLVMACKKCNLSKNKSDVFSWCKRKGYKIPEIVIELKKWRG